MVNLPAELKQNIIVHVYNTHLRCTTGIDETIDVPLL